MKRFLSAFLALALLLTLAPLMAVAATPPDFGWNSDGTDYSGWTVSDANNFTVQYTGSNNHRVWQQLLTDNQDFDLSVRVAVCDGGRAYVKLMDTAVELNCSGGNGNQIYNNNSRDWFDAAERVCNVAIHRENGGSIALTLTGAGNDTPVTTTIMPADESKQDVELGVYDAGNSASFTNLSIRLGGSGEAEFTNWEALSGTWTGTDTALSCSNEGEELAAAVCKTGYSGGFSVTTGICFKSFYQDGRLGTARMMLTGADPDNALVICDILAENNGKVYMTVQTKTEQDSWHTVKTVDWKDSDAGKYNNNYQLTVTRAEGADSIELTVTRDDGQTILGGAPISISTLSASQLSNLRKLSLAVKQAKVTFTDCTVEKLGGADIGGVWQGNATLWEALENGIAFLGSTFSPVYGIGQKLGQSRAFTVEATVGFTNAAGRRELLLTDADRNPIVTLCFDKDSSGTVSFTVKQADEKVPSVPEKLTFTAMEGTQAKLRITRLQDKDSLLITVNGDALMAAPVEELDKAAMLALQSQTPADFTDITVTEYPLTNAILPEGNSFSFQGSGWTQGEQETTGLWAQSSAADGSSAAAVYVGSKLSGDWKLNAAITAEETTNDGRAVSKLQLLDQYRNPKVIITYERLLATGQSKLNWQAIESANGGSWKTIWSTDWLKIDDTALNFAVTKTGDTGLTLAVTGNHGYTATANGVIASDVMQVLCYLGLLTENTTARFECVRVSTQDEQSDYAAIGKTAYDNLMKNFLDADKERLYAIDFGYVTGTVTNSGNTVTVWRAGAMWESTILLMAMDTYAQTLPEDSADRIQINTIISNTIDNFITQYFHDELVTPACPPINHAMDDCGWNVIGFLLGYRSNTALGRTQKAADCLALAKELFNNSYETYYDDTLGGGMWYNHFHVSKSLYAATLALAGYDLYEIDKDEQIKTRYMQIYQGVEDNLRRTDGLYWMGVNKDGYEGMDSPYGISEGGSCSYIGGNMCMAVLNARLGHTQEAKQTAAGIALYETSASGALLNDRDAWNNTFFIGLFVREIINSGIADEGYRTILQTTVQKILANTVFDSGYYSAAWEGPKEPVDTGYPSVVGSNYYEGERNRWGVQMNEGGYYVGSTPNQMMTSATTAHVLLSAAALAKADGKAELTALSVEGSTLWPVFDAEITQYATTVERSDTVTLHFTAADGAVITIDGNAVTDSYITDGTTQSVTLTVSCGSESKSYTVVLSSDCLHTTTETEVKAATCTEDGHERLVCTVCGEIVSETVLTKLGHEYLSEVTLAPTCSKPGVCTYTCIRGDDSYTEAIAVTACPSAAFTDVPGAEDWSHAGIDFAVERKLFSGTSATTFAPKMNMSRAMLVSVLWRLENQPLPDGDNNFTDVPDGSWYTTAVTWAAENKLVAGIGNGKFNPNGDITREQIAAIMFRYAAYKNMATDKRVDLTAFPDFAATSSFAKEAVSWAVAEGLISGISSGSSVKLAPLGEASRAQVAAIFMRYIQK